MIIQSSCVLRKLGKVTILYLSGGSSVMSAVTSAWLDLMTLELVVPERTGRATGDGGRPVVGEDGPRAWAAPGSLDPPANYPFRSEAERVAGWPSDDPASILRELAWASRTPPRCSG